MSFPNLLWAVNQTGPHYRFAVALGESESWLSRRMTGRLPFTSEDRERIASVLGYPAEWLFKEPQPPSRVVSKPDHATPADTLGVEKRETPGGNSRRFAKPSASFEAADLGDENATRV